MLQEIKQSCEGKQCENTNVENVNTIMKRLLSENVRILGLIESSELICAYGVAKNVSIRKRLLWDMRVNTEKKEGSRMINYIAWADEYGKQAHSLLKVIEKKKQKLKIASADEKKYVKR